ncbi:hypothetical protein AMATHDRAFT_2994 [Amanita thiersii Skay4041]|uniref:Uncharacterized protein n=1 Tax=Amanita thiersii Skay4041 TaxID=703135 RepID=A0A2A9NV58_9AGAR|nr:hypothetical protein AMATHDRAFT_2994 [Amanita thiersii Skay4041]
MKTKAGTSDTVRRITDYFSTKSPSSSQSNPVATTSLLSSQIQQDLDTKASTSQMDFPLRGSSRLTNSAQGVDAMSLKRLRSPDSPAKRFKAIRLAAECTKSTKRQRKSGSGAADDKVDHEVVHRGSSLQVPIPQVGGIMCDRERSGSAGPSELIPSSQSDEMELDSGCFFIRSPEEVKKCVEEWRLQTPMEGTEQLEDNASPMDDTSDAIPSPTLTSVPTTPNSVRSIAVIQAQLEKHARLETPPPVDKSYSDSLLRSPIVLDEKLKTALLIEKIKAEAIAKVKQLADSPPPQFDDSLDSSSDEDDLSLGVFVASKTKRTSVGVRISTSCEKLRPENRRTRQSRLASQSPLDTFPQLSKPVSSVKAVGKQFTRKPSGPNPLDVLLQEKWRLEKAGKDSIAFQEAESALRRRDSLLREFVNQDDEHIAEMWLDEDAARNAVRERDIIMNDSINPEGYTDEASWGVEQTKKMVGKDGKKVVDILRHDRNSEDQVSVGTHNYGLSFWEVTRIDFGGCSLQEDESVFQYSGENLILHLLKTSLDHRALTSAAFRALSSIYGHGCVEFPLISAGTILRVLADLGAKKALLEQVHWAFDANAASIILDAQERTDALLRLVHLLTIATQSLRIEVTDIPKIILMLMLITLDPSSTHELRMDTMTLIDALCKLATVEVERHVCDRVAGFALTQDAHCKAQVVCVFNNGSGPTRRVARWVAYSVLASQNFMAMMDCPELPPLQELLDNLTSSLFFEINDSSDYVALDHYIQILGVALTDIELYNEVERNARRSQEVFASPGKSRPKHRILLIHEWLERLHGQIQDTQALCLDRSRAKTAIKQLSLRLRYQYSDSAYDSGYGIGVPRKKTLHHFFSPKKS